MTENPEIPKVTVPDAHVNLWEKVALMGSMQGGRSHILAEQAEKKYQVFRSLVF